MPFLMLILTITLLIRCADRNKKCTLYTLNNLLPLDTLASHMNSGFVLVNVLLYMVYPPPQKKIPFTNHNFYTIII